jgi:two-component system response regulator QseB
MLQLLLVDDDAVNRRVITAMLATVGDAVTEAADARTALALIDARDFDVVLMDLRMPEIDGLTAIETIRARADDKANLPIVVITADVSAQVRDQSFAAGADSLLFKPVAMPALFEAIGRALGLRARQGVWPEAAVL